MEPDTIQFLGVDIDRLKIDQLKMQLYSDDLYHSELTSLSRTVTYQMIVGRKQLGVDYQFDIEPFLTNPIDLNICKIGISINQNSVLNPPFSNIDQVVVKIYFSSEQLQINNELINTFTALMSSQQILVTLRVTLVQSVPLTGISDPGSFKEFNTIIEIFINKFDQHPSTNRASAQNFSFSTKKYKINTIDKIVNNLEISQRIYLNGGYDRSEIIAKLRSINVQEGSVSNDHSDTVVNPNRLEEEGINNSGSRSINDYNKCMIKNYFTQGCLICNDQDSYLDSKSICTMGSSIPGCQLSRDEITCLKLSAPGIFYKNINPVVSPWIPVTSRCPHNDGYFQFDSNNCAPCDLNCKKCYFDGPRCEECYPGSTLDPLTQYCNCDIANCSRCTYGACDMCEKGFILHYDVMTDNSFSNYRCEDYSSGTCLFGYTKHTNTVDTGINAEKLFFGDFCFNRICYPGYSYSGGRCSRCGQEFGNCASSLKITSEKNEYKILTIDATQVTSVQIMPTGGTSWNPKSKCILSSSFNNCLACSSAAFSLTFVDKTRIKCDCKPGFANSDPSENNIACSSCMVDCKTIYF